MTYPYPIQPALFCNDVALSFARKDHYGLDGDGVDHEGTLIAVAPALGTPFGKLALAPGGTFQFNPTPENAIAVTQRACSDLEDDVTIPFVEAVTHFAESKMTLLHLSKPDFCHSEQCRQQIAMAQINGQTMDQRFAARYGQAIKKNVEKSVHKAYTRLQNQPL
jgi:hypothetical protein